MTQASGYVAVGQRIRAAREQLGLSEEAVAKRLGVTGATVSRYELAQSRIPLPDLVNMASVLGVDPAYLLLGQPATESERLMWQIHALTEGDRHFVAQLIDLLIERRRKSPAA